MRVRIFLPPIMAVMLLTGCNQEQQQAVDNSLDQAGDAVENTRPAIEEAGEDVSDAGISARVKTALAASDRIDSTGINVETENRVVVLKGTVPEAGQQSLAESVARDNVGSDVRVENQLQVHAAAASTPAAQ